MVPQTYQVFVNVQHAMLGNDALLKCEIPAYVSETVAPASWVVFDHYNNTVTFNLPETDYGKTHDRTLHLRTHTRQTFFEHRNWQPKAPAWLRAMNY